MLCIRQHDSGLISSAFVAAVLALLCLAACVPVVEAAGSTAPAMSHASAAAALAAVTATGFGVAAARVAAAATAPSTPSATAASVLGKRSRDAVDDEDLLVRARSSPASAPSDDLDAVRGRLPRAVMTRRGASHRPISPLPLTMRQPMTPLIHPKAPVSAATSDDEDAIPAVAPCDDAGRATATPNSSPSSTSASTTPCINDAAGSAASDADEDDYGVPDVDHTQEKPSKRARTCRGSRVGHSSSSSRSHSKNRVEFRIITVLRQSVNMCIYKHHNIARVKHLLAPVTGIPVSKMVVVLNSRVLADSETVAQAGITENAILLVRFLRNDATLSLSVTTLSGALTTMIVSPNTKVGKVKRALAEKHGMPVTNQRLLHSTVALEDDQPLSAYNLGESASILLLPIA